MKWFERKMFQPYVMFVLAKFDVQKIADTSEKSHNSKVPPPQKKKNIPLLKKHNKGFIFILRPILVVKVVFCCLSKTFAQLLLLLLLHVWRSDKDLKNCISAVCSLCWFWWEKIYKICVLRIQEILGQKKGVIAWNNIG